jgi:hypothetical protein
MKKIIFKPKPLSKAEIVYLKQLENRPHRLIFREIFNKVNIHKDQNQIPQEG